jgi:transposase InsO family protein
MSDNGPEFKGLLNKEHPETMCHELGIKHIYTQPYRPQTNDKIEAFWRILKDEFFYPNSFDSQGRYYLKPCKLWYSSANTLN